MKKMITHNWPFLSSLSRNAELHRDSLPPLSSSHRSLNSLMTSLCLCLLDYVNIIKVLGNRSSTDKKEPEGFQAARKAAPASRSDGWKDDLWSLSLIVKTRKMQGLQVDASGLYKRAGHLGRTPEDVVRWEHSSESRQRTLENVNLSF